MRYPKGYCDIRGAANYTGIPKKKMLEATKKGEIEYITIDGKKLVNAASVLDYMERSKIKMPKQNQRKRDVFVYYPSKPKNRVCIVCGKQFNGKQKICKSCNTRHKQIGESKAPLSALLVLKEWYPNENPFDVIERSPATLYRVFSDTKRKERHKMVIDATSVSKSKRNLAKEYTKYDIPPGFVKDLFQVDESKELLYITGSKKDPDVHFTCKRCGKTFCQKYSDLVARKGHDCEAVKSSGEAIVEDFLKRNRISYLTQRQTLKCVNPKTGAVLPYDFEIPRAKIVIEVQGNQHYHFVPHFHGSIENFEYEQWKDEYKREYAESKGYYVLYITYEDILSGEYENIIKSAIDARR